MPLSFSIVIDTLNRATLLAKTLDNLRWLKYRGRFEVIVVNGPSTDHSQEVTDALAAHDPRRPLRGREPGRYS